MVITKYKKFLFRLFISSVLISFFLPGSVGASEGFRLNESDGIKVISSTEQSLLLALEIPKLTILEEKYQNQEYQSFSVSGSYPSNHPGKIQLPVISGLVGIPENAEVKVSILQDDYEILQGDYLLPLAPSPKPIEDELTPGLMNRDRTFTYFNENQNYPIIPVIIGEEAWIRDQKIVRVEFYPIQYNPSTLKVTSHRRIRALITFTSPEQDTNGCLQTAIPSNNLYDPILQELLLNYDVARNWRNYPKAIKKSENDFVPSIFFNEATSGISLKISINKDGIYRIPQIEFANLGLNNLNPNKFNLSSQGNDFAYLIENDDHDDVFDQFETLIFYGQKFRGNILEKYYIDENFTWLSFSRQKANGSYELWKPQYSAKMLEKYTDENIFWLDWDNDSGPRINDNSGTPDNYDSNDLFRNITRAEEDKVWRTFPFTSEETWFWEIFKTSSPLIKKYPVILNNPDISNGNAVVRGEIVAATTNESQSPDHHVQLTLNEKNTEDLDIKWDGKSRYSFKFTVPQSQLIDGENILNLSVIPTNQIAVEELYFDWFEVDYIQKGIAVKNSFEITNRFYSFLPITQVFGNLNSSNFSIDTSEIPIIYPPQFNIKGFSNNQIQVFDITDELNPKLIQDGVTTQVSPGNYSISFQGSNKKYLVINENSILSPSKLEVYQAPQNINDLPPDYIFITNSLLLQETQTLANYRGNQGFSTRVVDIDDLYNQYNYGIINPIAIKQYLKSLYSSWGVLPKYVLLVGDGHWNLKKADTYNYPPQIIPPNLAWVDPWQGEVDSTNSLATIIGDDPLADLTIGRLPVNTPEEVVNYLQKLTVYESSSDQPWQQNFLFIADNTPDPAGDFVRLSEDIILEYLPPESGKLPIRIYLNNYLEPPAGTGSCKPNNVCPVVNQTITDTLNTRGAVLMNYTGHGSVQNWAGERIFINGDLATLINMDHLPVILSLTCLDGYYIHPGKQGEPIFSSLIEETIRALGKGAIGAFSPTGLGVATGHDVLQRGFFDSLFINNNWELGSASQFAKLKLFEAGYSYDLLQTFTIFGDPTLVIRGSK